MENKRYTVIYWSVIGSIFLTGCLIIGLINGWS